MRRRARTTAAAPMTYVGQRFTGSGRAIDIVARPGAPVTIDGCTFDGCGIFVQAMPGADITVTNCHAANIRPANGQEYAQFLQVSGLDGDAPRNVPIRLRVAYNVIVNEPGKSAVEDVINLIGVQGTGGVPLLVTGNTITGAYPADMSDDGLEHYSGGGIICDRGTCDALITANVVSDTTNYGVGVAAGINNRVERNTVTAKHAVNVGIYVSNRYKGDPFGGHQVHKNAVSWQRRDGTRNDVWIEGA